MATKEKLDIVVSKLSPEQKADVGSVLKEIEAEVIDLQNSLKAANSEAADRRRASNELKTKMIEQEEMIEGYKGQLSRVDDSPVKKELEAVKSKYKNVLGLQKNSFKSVFPKIKDHANFPKVKDRFVLPEKDGAVDFESMKDEDWEKNIAIFNDLNSLEYFGEVTVANVSMGKGTTNLSLKEAYNQELDAAVKAKDQKAIEQIYSKYKGKI